MIASLIGVVIGAEVFVERGLYADGSHFLVEMLTDRGFHDFDHYRRHAQLITQAPVVLALKLGVQKLHALMLAHSFGLFAVPVFFWLLALHRVRDDDFFWPMVLSFAVVYLNSSVMAVGEFNLAYGVAACALAILLRRKPRGAGDGVLLVVLAIVSTRTYEAMVFIAPVLCLLCLYRMVEADREHCGVATGALGLAAVAFIIVMVLGLESLQNFRDPENFRSARSLSGVLQNGQLTESVIFPGVYLLLFALRRFRPANTIAMMLAAGPLVLLLKPSLWAQPFEYHGARVAVGVFLVACAGVLALVRVFVKRSPRTPVSTAWAFAALPLTTLLVLGIVDIRHSVRFDSFRRCFEREVNARSGFVWPEDTRLRTDPACEGRYGWPWTNPSLSLLLREDASRSIILNARDYLGWQPFDPYVATPDLSAYTIGSRALE